LSRTVIATPAVVARQDRLDQAVARGELDRVRQQVPHHLLQARRIAGDHAGIGT
jgi:hypothetical protein